MTACKINAKVSIVKKDNRSGKERQWCRCVQTEWKIHIACLIFRIQLRPPLKTRNGLFVYAFIKPDQVDVWAQVPPREPWDDQMNCIDECWDCRLSEKTSGFFAQSGKAMCRHGSMPTGRRGRNRSSSQSVIWQNIAPSYNGQYAGLSLRKCGFDSRWSCLLRMWCKE